MIGKRIRNLRKKKGYSISELADISGVSKSYLSYIERDQKNPSLHFLNKVAASLETDLEHILVIETNHNSGKENMDEEWTNLILRAIDQGLTKEDFRTFQEFEKFKRFKDTLSKNEEHFGEKNGRIVP